MKQNVPETPESHYEHRKAVLADLGLNLSNKSLNEFCKFLEKLNHEERQQLIHSVLPTNSEKRIELLSSLVEQEQKKLHSELVFETKRPSIRRFKKWLSKMAGSKHFSDNERKAIVASANFWRKEFKLKFAYEGVQCALSTVTNGNHTVFRLRTHGDRQESIKRSMAFPKLELVD